MSRPEDTACRRCLLRDMADQADYAERVRRYRAALPQAQRTPDAAYEARLLLCRGCAFLHSGVCMQCGCFAEVRAARSDMHCPLAPALW